MAHGFPIFLNLTDRSCLVLGGGEVALRKIEQLLRADARVQVVARALCVQLQDLAASQRISHLAREFETVHLDGQALVIAATDDRRLNGEVAELARDRSIPVNVVDDPALCTFIMPSVIDRAPVIVAVSTGGESPVLARLLRARLESFIPAGYGRLARLLGEFREQARRKFPAMRLRRRFWETIIQGPVAELLFGGQEEEARRLLSRRLLDDSDQDLNRGAVYLVGAGPGDPDLLTFRALRLMQQADVVLHDRLVAPAVLDLVRRDAERIYVGKERDRHALPQEEINSLLIRLAREGKRVLRLKGGDPFVFGRGGEEIDGLAEAGIPFQVVPGITAATGCASYAGIPLTHRDYAQSCLFVTGHMQDGRLDLDWEALVRPRQTLAIYMGVHGLNEIAQGLVGHGMSPAMPAAIIERGTLPDQRVLISSVGAMAEMVQGAGLKAPAMIIIGEVVQLNKKLAWYESSGDEHDH
jgi:uroporphyrin-III C-methyltransferase/precorrin-2 dehydrogenase/sirohydrochlorin ferrochelatase